jgi:DNA-binding winged helix-turn-helix (wHTH) protein
MSRLRHRLDIERREDIAIQTIAGVGYRFVATLPMLAASAS